MKTTVGVLAVFSLIVVGALAYAHGPGWGMGQMMGPGYGNHMMGSNYGGHMMGPGHGGHMMGHGHGNHMMGWQSLNSEEGRKFLEETVDLRRDLHNRKFEYFEAGRNAETSPERLATLEKEIRELQAALQEKAPRTAMNQGGFGCW